MSEDLRCESPRHEADGDPTREMACGRGRNDRRLLAADHAVPFPWFATVCMGLARFALSDAEWLAGLLLGGRIFGRLGRAFILRTVDEFNRRVHFPLARERLTVKPLVVRRFNVRERLAKEEHVAAELTQWLRWLPSVPCRR